MRYLPSVWWKRIRGGLVALFVAWHLLMLFISNAELQRHVDSWREAGAAKKAVDIAEQTITAAKWYETMTGMDQGWALFTSPLARKAPFLGTHLIFDDGSRELVKSPTEPDDMTRFLRFGGTRYRKLESHLLIKADYPLEAQLARRYVQHAVTRWRSKHPHDPRRPITGVLVRRELEMPPPGEFWSPDHPVEEEEIARFELDQEP